MSEEKLSGLKWFARELGPDLFAIVLVFCVGCGTIVFVSGFHLLFLFLEKIYQ